MIFLAENCMAKWKHNDTRAQAHSISQRPGPVCVFFIPLEGNWNQNNMAAEMIAHEIH